MPKRYDSEIFYMVLYITNSILKSNLCHLLFVQCATGIYTAIMKIMISNCHFIVLPFGLTTLVMNMVFAIYVQLRNCH